MQLRRKSNVFGCCATQGRRSRTENKLNEKYPSAMGKKKLRYFSIKRDLFSFIRDEVYYLPFPSTSFASFPVCRHVFLLCVDYHRYLLLHVIHPDRFYRPFG